LEAINGSWADVVPLADTCPAYRWCLFAWNLLGEAAMPVWVPNTTGVEELAARPSSHRSSTITIVRGVLFLAETSSHQPQAAGLLDATGRRVLELQAGANDVSLLASGVYYVASGEGARSTRVVILGKE